VVVFGVGGGGGGDIKDRLVGFSLVQTEYIQLNLLFIRLQVSMLELLG
jgi:hypothetical protein